MNTEHDKLQKENEVKIRREVKYQWGWKSVICLEESTTDFTDQVYKFNTI